LPWLTCRGMKYIRGRCKAALSGSQKIGAEK
jgi:hypothetical protein